MAVLTYVLSYLHDMNPLFSWLCSKYTNSYFTSSTFKFVVDNIDFICSLLLFLLMCISLAMGAIKHFKYKIKKYLLVSTEQS